VLGRSLTAEDDPGRCPRRRQLRVLTRALAGIRRSSADADARQPFTVVGVTGSGSCFSRGLESNGEPAALYRPIAFSWNERQGFGSM
jgi:hypothetical protein